MRVSELIAPHIDRAKGSIEVCTDLGSDCDLPEPIAAAVEEWLKYVLSEAVLETYIGKGALIRTALDDGVRLTMSILVNDPLYSQNLEASNQEESRRVFLELGNSGGFGYFIPLNDLEGRSGFLLIIQPQGSVIENQ